MDEREFQHLHSNFLHLARIRSRQVARAYRLLPDDADDIQQELVLDYLRRLPRFESHRGSRTAFAQLTIRNRISTLVAERSASSRGYRACHLPLDELPAATFPCPRQAQVALIDPKTGIAPDARLVQRLDVKRAMKHLTVPLKRICILLMICDKASEVADMAGISRATLYRRILLIRAAFVQAGLSE
jgi:RNA polymerase sigma-70 factor, ECF subfamily